LVYFIFLSDGGAHKPRGARGKLPLSLFLDGKISVKLQTETVVSFFPKFSTFFSHISATNTNPSMSFKVSDFCHYVHATTSK